MQIYRRKSLGFSHFSVATHARDKVHTNPYVFPLLGLPMNTDKPHSSPSLRRLVRRSRRAMRRGCVKNRDLEPAFFQVRYGKTGNKKRATCFTTLLQNELKNDVARYTSHIKPVLQQIRLLTGLNMGGKTRNIAI